MDASQGTARDQLRRLFLEHPGQWFDGLRLAQIAGAYAWRTRTSELRTLDGLDIENRQRREGRRVVSEYRWVPRAVPVQEALWD